MCGRDTFFATWAQVHAFSQPLALQVPAENPAPSWNRAPSQFAGVIVGNHDGAEVQNMRWGLVPFWAKDAKIAYATINARVETAAEKPAFRAAWRQRRCVVPSSGYYEWQVLPDGKQPWFIHPPSDPVFLFAGLWERWQPEGHEPLFTYSILTRPAVPALQSVHDRMPVLLPPAQISAWLCDKPEAVLADLLGDASVPLACHRVRAAVGNPRNNDARLIEAMELPSRDA